MGRRTKQAVKNRSRNHQKRVKAGHKTRKRARARGLHSPSKRRRMKAARRARKR